MTALATRVDLDQLTCDEAGCDCRNELVLQCADRHAATVAIYSKGGELRLECAECEKAIVTVRWPADEAPLFGAFLS
jgi:hypothetical protein